jgi:hypothetical protein
MNSLRVVVPVLLISLIGCQRDNPLADLPHFIAPLVDRSKCEPVPPTTKVTLPAKGPFVSCSGVFPSHEGFGLMRDSLGRTVWFARGWRALPREHANTFFDSLSHQMTREYGAATPCGRDRRVWSVRGFSLELSLASVADEVRRADLEASLPWHVQFLGRVGPPEPRCPPGT